MTYLPAHLQENEQAAIGTFAQRLQQFLKDELCHLWLFGSKARGDYDADSDLDILIIIRNMNFERRSIIQRMAARISLDFDTLINTHIKEKAEWDAIVHYQHTLWREVQRDGIPLHVLSAEPVT